MKEVIREHNANNLFSVEGKVIMIAGGGGLGTCLGKAFIENGAHVVFTARRQMKLDILENELIECGLKNSDYELYIMDQRNKSEIEKTMAKIKEKNKTIDVLFNTIGIAPNDTAEDFPEDQVKNVIDTNLNAVIYTTQVVGKEMIKNRKGKIINIGSVAGYTPHTYISMPYQAAKAGVHQATKAFAVAWGKYNVNVNCIAPTWIRTPMVDDKPENYLKAVVDMHEFGRMAEADDFVGAGIFLASDASNFITGNVLYVDGGWSAGKPVKFDD